MSRVASGRLRAEIRLQAAVLTLALTGEAGGVGDGVEWLRRWTQDNGLAIDERTNFPLWDGKHPDYKIAVEGLLDAG